MTKKRTLNSYEFVQDLIPGACETIDKILIILARNEICTDPSFYVTLEKIRPGQQGRTDSEEQLPKMATVEKPNQHQTAAQQNPSEPQ